MTSQEVRCSALRRLCACEETHIPVGMCLCWDIFHREYLWKLTGKKILIYRILFPDAANTTSVLC